MVCAPGKTPILYNTVQHVTCILITAPESPQNRKEYFRLSIAELWNRLEAPKSFPLYPLSIPEHSEALDRMTRTVLEHCPSPSLTNPPEN
ncbi:hypothetical protein CDAR_445971 [Caerostris darwini]|uniref:Uncharacterized protein n=1 Tax=Caerostris darwini TaxID=1538125 RepID=A0AAV4U0H7_9ARAC|nr:hypothetical protein CDAR_445971 [Caerostris darwini]